MKVDQDGLTLIQRRKQYLQEDWKIFKAIRSWQDIRDFYELMIPSWIESTIRWTKHPKQEFKYYKAIKKHNSWASSKQIGDQICYHGEHIIISEKEDWDSIRYDDGKGWASLTACCVDIELDGTCHTKYNNPTEEGNK